MIGHAPTLTETNSHGWVPLCECGWIGGVVAVPAPNDEGRPRRPARIEFARALALDYHALHVHEAAADVARQSDLALVAHGRLIDRANETLQHRGRFGLS